MSLPSKIPPHSIEAEQSVLGSILIDKDALIKCVVLVDPSDFFDPKHVLIYEAMTKHYREHIALDLLTLTHTLETDGHLEKIGETYLAELTSIVPTASHVISYAQIVKKNSVLRKMISAGGDITALGYEEGEKIEDLLARAEKSVFNITQTFLKERFVHVKEILDARFEIFAEVHESDASEVGKGVPTGFPTIEKLIGAGFQPSDLIILAARPSMGKTALALNFAQNIAMKFKQKVGIFSLEMSKEQLVDRLFCSIVGVDSWKLKKGELSDEDFANLGPAMDDLSRASIFIDDSMAASITEVKAKARRLQMEHGLDFLIIDYLQLMTSGTASATTGNRVQEISEISRALKALGRELHIPVLALSQLSRAVEMRPGKIPQLSDLRDSGSIEQDADMVFMLYREDYYEPDTDRKGRSDLFLRKNRNGPVGSIELMFKSEQMRFYEVDKIERSE